MQFVRNGPDIPDTLLQAHQEGRVVFFCGAGISYPAGLPGFGGLVSRIYDDIGVEPTDIEKTAFKSKLYDTAVSLLEGRVVGNRSAVRLALARALTPNLAKPRATQTHEALITLSRNTKGQFRLITTNFDRLFVLAAQKLNFPAPWFEAPLLPVPKKKWDGIVYLHGLLPDGPTPAALDKLVISSGDFGLAYLTERWAARFVSELFRSYTVCFVGYSINDPVMRYMMDALAADRLLGEKPLEVFAFGSYQKGREVEAANEWAAKNVTPILYRNRSQHTYLHSTLKAWADTYRDGIRGKESIVTRHAATFPTGSTVQDNFVGRVLWALSDTTGLPAKHFADLEPVPPIEWLKVFSERRFLHRDLIRFGIKANDDEDKELRYSLIARPSPYTRAPWMTLVPRMTGISAQWDGVMGHIARWLARHIGDPQLVLWIAEQGGQLDFRLKHIITRALQERPPQEPLASLWRIVVAGRLQDSTRSGDPYTWGRDLARTGLTPLLRMELRRIFSPRLRISEGYRWASEEEPSTDLERFNSAIDWEIVFDADFAHAALEDIARNEHWQRALPDLLGQSTDLLQEAMDLMQDLCRADNRHDRSHWDQPSISPHAQNQKHRDWTVLIEMLRDAWLATADASVEAARREVYRWSTIQYPIFRRFVFFAAAERPALFPPDEVLAWLLDDNAWWFWASETQREVLRLIAAFAPIWTAPQRERLEQVIEAGLPDEMVRPGSDPDQIERVRERETWRRLGILSAAAPGLGASAQSSLDNLLAAHPEWGAPNERDEFPVWFGSDGSWRNFSQTPRSRDDLEVWIRENSAVDELRREDDFRERCRTDMPRVMTALLSLAGKGEWPTDRWKQALQAWSHESFAKRAWRWLKDTLTELQNVVFEVLAHAIGFFLKNAAKELHGDTIQFFRLAERVIEVYRDEIREPANDPLTEAINHPVGYVIEAVLTWWYGQKLEDNQGIAEPVRSIFSRVASPEVQSYRHGRIILCSHIITLFRVDRDWSTTHLLPFFNWETSAEAHAAWTGFLWSPRLYWPLMTALRKPFLETVVNYDPLDKHYVGLLTFAALEREDPFTINDFATATAKLSVDGLARAIRVLSDGMQSAGDRRAEYWQNRVKPYLRTVWPKTQNVRTREVSTEFAKLLAVADNTFPDALNTLRNWILPTDDAGFVLRQLYKSGLCGRFPNEALDLIDLLVSNQLQWSAGSLRDNLGQIRNARPELAADPRFLRLVTVVRQANVEF